MLLNYRVFKSDSQGVSYSQVRSPVRDIILTMAIKNKKQASEMGKRSWKARKKKYGVDHMAEIGRKDWEKQSPEVRVARMKRLAALSAARRKKVALTTA